MPLAGVLSCAVCCLQLLGETPVHARVKPGSLRVIVPPPAAVPAEEVDSAEAGDEPVIANQEGKGSASQPDGAPTEPLVEASAQVENHPIVAPAKQDE